MQLILVQPALVAGASTANLDAVLRAVERDAPERAPHDVVVLPEHCYFDPDPARYEQAIATLARRLGCHLVGGSHHRKAAPEPPPPAVPLEPHAPQTRPLVQPLLTNSGAVFDGTGRVVMQYDKLRPYAAERRVVRPGTRRGCFEIDGRAFLVMVCADFWFTDLFLAGGVLPDAVVVPALSVTRRPDPAYSRALWRHTAIARAYEFGVFVGVSDWAHASSLNPLPAAGVAGFADPTRTHPEAFFQTVPESGALCISLDFQALDAFRQDRAERGFYWTPPSSLPSSNEAPPAPTKEPLR